MGRQENEKREKKDIEKNSGSGVRGVGDRLRVDGRLNRLKRRGERRRNGYERGKLIGKRRRVLRDHGCFGRLKRALPWVRT